MRDSSILCVLSCSQALDRSVSGVIESREANDIQFGDPDGNPIYAGDRDYVEDPWNRRAR